MENSETLQDFYNGKFDWFPEDLTKGINLSL